MTSLLTRRQCLPLLGLSALAAARPVHAVAAGRDKVVVIGAGIIGASIAYHLTRRGADVTLIEKERPAAGTSRNSFAWLNAFEKKPLSYYALNYDGILGWRRLQQEIGPSLVIQWGGGVSWLPPDAAKVAEEREHIRQLQQWGYPLHEIDQPQLLELVHGVQPGPFGSGWTSTIDGTLDPVTTTSLLVESARRLGARVVYPATVTAIDRRSDGRVRGVTTSSGAFTADYVVLAAGNDIPALAQAVGLNVPLKLSRGVLAHSKPLQPTIGRVLMPPGGDIKQNPDGRIVTGSNFGDSGNTPPTREVGDRFLDLVRRFVPQASGIELDYMTLGHRVLPSDGHPIVGQAKSAPGLYVAAMHSGMTQAPIIGQLMAIEVLDQVQTVQLADYRPDRFG